MLLGFLLNLWALRWNDVWSLMLNALRHTLSALIKTANQDEGTKFLEQKRETSFEYKNSSQMGRFSLRILAYGFLWWMLLGGYRRKYYLFWEIPNPPPVSFIVVINPGNPTGNVLTRLFTAIFIFLFFLYTCVCPSFSFLSRALKGRYFVWEFTGINIKFPTFCPHT